MEDEKKIATRKLGLDKERSPEFHEIVEENNALMDEWNRVNRVLVDSKQPRLWLFGHKKKLQKIGRELRELQDRFITWNERSGNMLYKPHFRFRSDQESEVGFIHYTNVLRDLRNSMDRRMVLIADNYNRRHDEHNSQVNFIIAITAFFLTFIGLIATLITLGEHCKRGITRRSVSF